MTLPVVFAIAGCIALLIGLFGGGVKAKEIEVPVISAWQRIVLGLVGAALIGIAIWVGYPTEPASPAPQSTPGASLVPSPSLAPTLTASPVMPIVPSATPVKNNVPFELAGNWQGTDSSLDILRFTFNEYCNVGEICGTLAIPTSDCKEFPVLVSINGETFVFQETNQQGCSSPTGNDTLVIRQDGSALFGANGQPPTTILYRQP